jgi:hypothetical protein
MATSVFVKIFFLYFRPVWFVLLFFAALLPPGSPTANETFCEKLKKVAVSRVSAIWSGQMRKARDIQQGVKNRT